MESCLSEYEYIVIAGVNQGSVLAHRCRTSCTMEWLALHVGRGRANWFCRQCSGGCSSNMDVRQYGNEIIDTINHKPEGNDQREVDFKVEFGLIAGERS